MEDNENYDGILRKALAIEDLPENFDPNKIPQTGEEYIHYVMYEAKQCKEWVTANIDQEKFRNKQSTIITEPTGCVSAPQDMIPSTSWQQKQVADFSAFRLHLQKLKQENSFNNTPPFNGEADQWHKKCSREPKLSEVLGLNQRSLCKVLDFFTEWLNNYQPKETISHTEGIWLYALLACLETPLLPETCATLREIARKCSQIRAFLPKNSEKQNYQPLNLFICLIAKYFNNHDLADNENEM